MTPTECAVIVAPLLGICCLAAIADIGLRVHGGLDTPTPAADAVLAVGRHLARIACRAVPVAFAAVAMPRARKGRP